ncbi:hypothetical protein NRIC_31760 [Enterococcus florum]|uniref:DUF4428 domain-containing protein n=1 Tax=Enterococcus florum TaxID=2480627 RepID=A0A4P5PAX7_9ENTE|nr:DUF4428 domain-containing protein [Enterococcus florum]GCF95285.1 hypothetical protein NRIC_31760 [Enterococcus florum]
MKECLLCDRPLKLIKFKSAEGYVCKQCYEKVSLNFTQTIKNQTKAELLSTLENTEEANDSVSFEITRKINQYILFDDKHQQLCLPNHKKYTKDELKPEVYPFSAIVNCQIDEEQVEKVVKKKKQALGCIKVTLVLQEEDQISRDIWLIPNLISTSSMPYKTMRSLAQNIVQEVERSKQEVAVC